MSALSLRRIWKQTFTRCQRRLVYIIVLLLTLYLVHSHDQTLLNLPFPKQPSLSSLNNNPHFESAIATPDHSNEAKSRRRLPPDEDDGDDVEQQENEPPIESDIKEYSEFQGEERLKPPEPLFVAESEEANGDAARVDVVDDGRQRGAVGHIPEVDESELRGVDDLGVKPALGIAGTWSDASVPLSPRQTEIVAEFQYAWAAYKAHAWGRDTLKPISKSYDTWFDMGLTLLDSLDNLILFRMDKEFEEAKHWVSTQLTFDRDVDYVNLFECTIRVLGGLLSAYTLSADPMFKDKAEDIGARLLTAWEYSKTDIPLSDINPYRRRARPPKWGSDSSTSEVTTVQMEFRELAVLANDSKYSAPAIRTSKYISDLVNKQPDHKFVHMFVNPHSGKMKSGGTITFGARTDSYYEYLLKQWIQSNGDARDEYLLNDYLATIRDLRDRLIKVTRGEHKLTFVAELQGARIHPKMDHLVCFLPGTLALGHWYTRQVHLKMDIIPDWHLDLAKELARTCHYMYSSWSSGLAPEIVYFNLDDGSDKEIEVHNLDRFSLLRPEAVECWFYLYRVTGDQQYRDWGWDFFTSLKAHARLDNNRGYASVSDVTATTTSHRDKMESFFLAETMKYLFLLFSDDKELLPLDKFVFNTEAHPLLVRTRNNEKMFLNR